MGDRIAVMNKGHLQQCDSPLTLYNSPANKFVAGFIGSPSMNFFDGTLVEEEGNLFIDTGNFRLAMPADKRAMYKDYIGKNIDFGIRPEHIHDVRYQPADIAAAPLKGQIDLVELLGHELHVYLNNGSSSFVAAVDSRSDGKIGDTLDLVADMNNMHLFDKETELAIR